MSIIILRKYWRKANSVPIKKAENCLFEGKGLSEFDRATIIILL